MSNVLKIKKIENKIKLKDLKIESDPCKILFTKYGVLRGDDCMHDCKKGHPANGSIAY
nr:hypothetical protein [uncultured Peptostreptococcus sp.]